MSFDITTLDVQVTLIWRMIGDTITLRSFSTAPHGEAPEDISLRDALTFACSLEARENRAGMRPWLLTSAKVLLGPIEIEQLHLLAMLPQQADLSEDMSVKQSGRAVGQPAGFTDP